MTIQQHYIFFAALAALILISLITVPAAALAPPGGIQVYSTPTSAYACVDGGNCQYTPATFDGLTSNTYHTVTIYLSGYQTYTENVLVTAQATDVVNAYLQPVPVTTGSIQLYSTPSGATACVDGGNCQTTPATFDRLSDGTYHSLTISSPGYQTDYENVMVIAQETTVVNAVLQKPQPATGSLQVYITPGGGTICLDSGQCQAGVGTASGTGSYQYSGVSANGYHTITAAENGYQPFTTEVYVQPDQVNEVNAVLQPLINPTGNIQVFVTPGGGTVCLDGVQCDANVGVRDSIGSTQFSNVLANTRHTITVITSGYQPYSLQVSVAPGQTVEVNALLQPATPVATVNPANVPTTVTPTTVPPTTKAGLTGFAALVAIGICGAAVLSGNKKQ
ncbi:MAG: PEGA domain-containing protein [Methanoregula sp.]|jgi:hypothetical protein|uniref:PEGA domain-containing protein n=1 Tax=Methanoregula sp. TaxID=2052170 RepID=UPI003D11FEBF